MPRHEANQALPAVSALHTHFDVSGGMGLNAKRPGQQLERRYLYNYRGHSCCPEYRKHLLSNFFLVKVPVALSDLLTSCDPKILQQVRISGNQVKAINQMRLGKRFLKKKIYIFFYIYADMCLCFIIMERRDLFYFYSTVSPNIMHGIIKSNILGRGPQSVRLVTEPICTHAVNIRSHVPYGFSKAISCSQKQSFLFIKGL